MAEYLEAVTESLKYEFGKFAFRGQGDVSHPISSTAARRLGYNKLGKDALSKFNDYNSDLISDAKLKGYDKKGNRILGDLELLAELQHNGAATALIDFTYSSLVALYFASVNDPDKDGVVYIINTLDFGKFQKIDSGKSEWKFKQYMKNGDAFLWVWEPSDLNNRIPKQHSLFILGKPEISSESIKNITIDADKKARILYELQKIHDVGGLTLFNDMIGFASENSCENPYYSEEYLLHMNKAKSMWVTDNLNVEEIMEYVEKALKINPISYEALNFGVELKHSLNDYPGVIEIGNRILEINPDNFKAHSLIGNATLEMEKELLRYEDNGSPSE